MVNWKTTVAGICSIVSIVVSVIEQAVQGHFDQVNLAVVISGLVAGFGLIFAKDRNVTGGTIASTDEAAARLAAVPAVGGAARPPG